MGFGSKNRRWVFILLSGVIVSASCSSNNPDADTALITIIAESAQPTPTTMPAAGENGSVSTTKSSTVPVEAIPDSGVLIVPAGPHTDGQTVEVLAASSPPIDLYNSSPRLCARVDDAAEICDPTWIQPRPISNPPAGTQGVTVELPRIHFGPTGNRDCADTNVDCRLVWRTETNTLLTSENLAFTGPTPATNVTLQAVTGDQPGKLTLTANGVDDSLTASEVFSTTQLDSIAESVSFQTNFEPSNLDIGWRVGGLCGFGPGTPPIGSDGLDDPPAWWALTTLDPTSDPAEVRSFFAPTCDSLTTGIQIENETDTPVVPDVARSIYGFGGWIDCAESACWIELNLSWTYPMPDGSALGGDVPAARVLVDVPASWPSTRPSIEIVEPGPYSAGQQVTIEVRNHPLQTGGLDIGWCAGGDDYCGYRFSTYDNGIHRVAWVIPADATNCGESRCYFEIGSPSEGLAPPAITIVPITNK